ncbi:MAG: F0F1 ATP synthase subunit delta [Sulfurovum sp.]|nr:F0F1 ATP synthase subunit delta [Sulfurovum sp.]
MFNWWTFLFQTINFFVVLYILYRLFFNPLKTMIQKREESLKKRLEALQTGENELREKEQHYQEKLKEIDILKDKAFDTARKEAEEEKSRLLEKAERELEKEREKQKSIQAHERKKIDSAIKEQSLRFSLDYIARFARELIDESMHQKLIEKFLHALKSEEREEEIEALKKEIEPKAFKIRLATPLKIEEQTMHKIKKVLGDIFDTKAVTIETFSDASLIGGIKLEIGNRIIDGSIAQVLAQLQDEAEKALQVEQ